MSAIGPLQSGMSGMPGGPARLSGLSGLSGPGRADLAWRSAAAPADRMLTGEQRSFMDVIGRGGMTAGAQSAEAEARDAAEQLVAITFVQPILAQLRETNQAAPPFAPTQGEKQFGALIDAELAREITSAAQFPLVERVARDLLRLPPEPARTPGHGRSP